MPRYLSELWTENLYEKSTEELWDYYVSCLKAHDWTYMYSDDPTIYSVGSSQNARIDAVRQILEKKNPKKTKELYYKYSPWHEDSGELKS